MSWSASFKVDEHGEVVDESVNESNVDLPHHQDQYEAALNCVWDVLRTGALGRGKGFQVNLSGHGNEGHVPAPGWSNDSLSLTIYQLSES
jgi:hypothetical protein